MQFKLPIKRIMRQAAALVTGLLVLPQMAAAVEQAASVQKALPHSSAGQMVKMVIGLLFVLLLIFFLAWVVKRYLGVGLTSNAALKTVAGIAVGQKERVVLVQVGERQLLIGVAPGQVNMLHALEKGDEIKPAASDEARKGVFAEKLKNSLSMMDKK